MKKDYLRKVVVLLTVVFVLIANTSAFAHVLDVEDHPATAYDLTQTISYDYNGTAKTVNISKFSDVAVYTDDNGQEYVYAMEYGGSKGVFGFERKVDEATSAVTYEPFSLKSADYRQNNYQLATVYNALEVVNNSLYVVQQKSATDAPIVIKFSLSNPKSLSVDVQLKFSEKGTFEDFKVVGNKIYGLSTKGIGIIDFTDTANLVKTEYDFSSLTSNVLTGIDSETNGSIEVKDGYIYISATSTDSNSNKNLCVWAIKETENGLQYVGKKEYYKTTSNERIIDSVISNNTLYVSAVCSTAYKTGVYAVDIIDPENFSNAIAKNNVFSTTGINKAYTMTQSYGMDTDGRYLYVADSSQYGLTVFDTIGGVDLLTVGGNETMKGTNVELANGRVYQANTASAKLYVWDYDISTHSSDLIGYSPFGHNVTINQTAGKTTAKGSSTSANGICGFGGYYNGEWRTLQLYCNNDVTLTYTITSDVDCEKALYLQARLRGFNSEVSVNVNGVDTYSTEEIVSPSGSVLANIYMCDVKLNKGTNTIAVNFDCYLNETGTDETVAGIQVGGIGLSYNSVDDTNGLSFGKTEFSTEPVAGATVKARTTGWQTANAPKYGTVKVIYATYDVEGSMIDAFYDDLSMSELLERKYIDIDVDVTSETREIRRFVFGDFEDIYPMCDCEITFVAE